MTSEKVSNRTWYKRWLASLVAIVVGLGATMVAFSGVGQADTRRHDDGAGLSAEQVAGPQALSKSKHVKKAKKAKKHKKHKKAKKNRKAKRCAKGKRGAKCRALRARRGATTARVTISGGRWAGALDTTNLEAVNSAYLSEYASGLATPTGYTGNDKNCVAGTSSQASRTATLRAINFTRSLSGLTPVSFDAAMNSKAQQTALMMSANGALSHSPGTGWNCYTTVGAKTAGVSNLALAYPSITSAGMIGMYMDELGSSNVVVGHRRWLLNPFATVMGSGSTNNANAITVIGSSNPSNPNPAWVPWPSENYFPAPLEPKGRWSLSAGHSGANFANATVSMSGPNGPISVNRYAPKNGYAQPTLVWQVPGSINPTGIYRVTVNNIKVGNATTSYSYAVQMFKPAA
jgi:uncharacterized protein YkwD